MSWYGSHAPLRQGTARQLLPPATCKRCIYFFRLSLLPMFKFDLEGKCSRCGIDKNELQKLIEHGRALVKFEEHFNDHRLDQQD